MISSSRSAASVCAECGIGSELTANGSAIAYPRTEDEAAELVRASGAAGVPMAPTGFGSSLSWCRPDQDAETLLMSTRSLIEKGGSGIVEYVPGDGVLTAQAGTPFETLHGAVREGGHRLTPLIAGTSSLGGALAAGLSGPDRCAFGPARNHVLGARVLDGGGRSTRSGGRLVKNVTGFDVHRLHVGARGSLGVLLEISLRLMPIPESEVLLRSSAFETSERAVTAALEVRADPGVRPSILAVRGTRLIVGLAGRTRQVDAAERATGVYMDVAFEDRGPDATMEFAREARSENGALSISTRPSRVRGLVRALESSGVPPGDVTAYPDAASIEIDAIAVRDHAGDLEAPLAAALREAEAQLVVRGAVPRAFVDLARDLSRVSRAQRAWTTRLYASFDPNSVFRIRGSSQFTA